MDLAKLDKWIDQLDSFIGDCTQEDEDNIEEIIEGVFIDTLKGVRIVFSLCSSRIFSFLTPQDHVELSLGKILIIKQANSSLLSLLIIIFQMRR